MASLYDSYVVPPVTCNTLDNYQRARLIRSTRKLGAVLGTTPRLAEADECPFEGGYAYAHDTGKWHTKASRRHGSIFTLFPETASSSKDSVYSTSSNSSLVSLTSTESHATMDVVPTPKTFPKGRRSADVPRPLVLRINAVPVAPTDTRVPLSPIRSAAPMSPTFSDTQTTPTVAEVRRKRMAKLKRTLGENVPPEMVFPETHRHTPLTAECTPVAQGPRPSSRVWVTSGSNGGWVGEWNRRDIGEVQHKLRTLKAR